jgi:hypothetical protein
MLELLIATSIFVVIGTMIFGIMRASLDMWSRGETERDIRERASSVLDRIAEDLRLTYAQNPLGVSPPPVEFVCDWTAQDRDGDGMLDFRAQRLRFVRINTEERTNPLMVNAGEDSLAQHYFNLIDDQDRKLTGNFLPTEGLAEICYATMPVHGKDSPGALLLGRAYRSPPGTKDSLFANEGLGMPGTFSSEFLMMADDVLYLGFRFRTTRSQSFEPNGQGDGGFLVWDSTRARLPRIGGIGAFLYSQSDDQTAMARTDDDIYPFQVEVTLIVARSKDDDRVTTLNEGVSADTLQPLLQVGGTAFLKNGPSTEGLIKVDEEWMRVRDLGKTTIQIAERGVLGSPRYPHPKDTTVRQGIVFRRVITIPCYREDWNS